MKAVRWGDNDRYLGPFTWHADDWKKWSVVLKSRGDDDYESGVCSLRISAYSYTLIAALPNIVKPHMEKVYPGWDAATVERLGRDWYWNIDPRQYGFSCSDGHFNVYYGRSGGSTMDSRTEQRWSCFLPWTQWRHVRRSLYDLHGAHFWSELDSETANYRRASMLGRRDLWRERREIVEKWEAMCPTAKFRFRDFDGEEIEATTRIEQCEWHFGTGWFRWLRFFRKAKIRGSLDIRFSAETGKRKGSWKGGTIGHSIEMLPGELHESAFKRYCQEHDMKFVQASGLSPDFSSVEAS